jgi:hypothetical protein
MLSILSPFLGVGLVSISVSADLNSSMDFGYRMILISFILGIVLAVVSLFKKGIKLLSFIALFMNLGLILLFIPGQFRMKFLI